MKASLFAAALLVAGCSLSAGMDDTDPVELRALSAAERASVTSDNTFGFDLFDELVSRSNGENVFMSPTSVSFALGMTANGAAGSTRDGMMRALRKDHLDLAEVNAAYRDLTGLLTNMDPRVTLDIANSIWYREGYPVLPSFLETNRTYFDAEVAEVDFSLPEAPTQINDWVDDKTRGLITKVVETIDPSVVMLLINAIYFKGDWVYAFDPDDTYETTFHGTDGLTQTTPMMTLQTDLRTLVSDRFMMADLPYGDSLFSMTVILPAAGITTDDLMADLNAESWAAWESQLRLRDTVVHLPRFKISYKESLVESLTALGMGEAFTPGPANFSNLVDGGGPWIDDVIHQAVLDVNEEGTEAAAVTTVVIVETSAGGGPLQFVVNRPFLLLMRERHTGTILFMGRIGDLS